MLSINTSLIRYTSICCTDYSNLNSIPNFPPFYHLVIKNTLVTFTISVHVLLLERILMIYDIDGFIRENLYGNTITLQGLVPCKNGKVCNLNKFQWRIQHYSRRIIKGETVTYSLTELSKLFIYKHDTCANTTKNTSTNLAPPSPYTLVLTTIRYKDDNLRHSRVAEPFRPFGNLRVLRNYRHNTL